MTAMANNNPDAVLACDDSSDHRLAAFLKLATRLEWEIMSCDHIGVQLRQKKRYGATYYFVGALTAVVGIGLLVWIFGWIDYVTKRDRLIYIPRVDLIRADPSTAADLLR